MDIKDSKDNNLLFENCIGLGKRYLSVKNLAMYLDISEKTLRKWIDQRRIPFVRFRNSTAIRFDILEIEKWISPA